MKHKFNFFGQALVEFALILPIMLALLLGFFDLGRALFYSSSLKNAVREGSRSGIVMRTRENVSVEGIKTAIKNEVLEYAFGLTTTTVPLTIGDIDVEILYDTKGYFEILEITATYCYVPITPGIKEIIGNGCHEGATKGIELTAESVMRFEPMLK